VTPDQRAWSSLRILVRNSAAVDRRQTPVTLGVPFPRSALAATDGLALRQQDGTPIALQTAITGRWDDGSVRWLLLDFLADVPAGQHIAYLLEKAPRPEAGRTAGSEPAAITDREGAASRGGSPRFTLDGGICCTLGANQELVLTAGHGVPALRLDRQDDPAGQGDVAARLQITAIDGYGRSLTASFTAEPTPEAAGPVRAALELPGNLKPATAADGAAPVAGVQLRLQTTARPELRATVTLVNDTAQPLALEAVELVLTLPGAPLHVACSSAPDPAAGGGQQALAAAPGAASILQTGPTAWGPVAPFELTSIRRGENDAPVNGLAVGLQPPAAPPLRTSAGRLDTAWCAAVTTTVRARLELPRFATMHPKRLSSEVRDGHACLVASLLPAGCGGFTLAPGVAAAMDVVLGFAPTAAADAGAPTAGGLEFLADSRPPLAAERAIYPCADPAWLCASDALGDMIPADDARWPRYEWLTRSGLDALAATRQRRHEYGQLDYGDWAYDRYPNGWGNVEYDLPHALFLLYARSGEPRFLDWALDTVHHYMATDINHGGDERLPGGAPHVHHTDHVGRGNDLGHTWLEGLLDCYHLTGEPRALAAARGVADFCVDAVQRTAFARRSERAIGWMLICLTEMYRATNEDRYLAACAPVIEQALTWQDPVSGHWPNPIPECDRQPKCLGGKPFMVGIVLEGLRRYHEASGDARVADAIIRASYWLVRDDVWIAADRGFIYATCHRYQGQGRTGEIRELDGLLYAYRLSGERRFLDVALDAWDAALQAVGQPYHLDGKGYAILTRSTPHVLARLAGVAPERQW
jgi:hypothetical protein